MRQFAPTESRTLSRLVTLVAAGLAAAAVIQELRKPPDHRSWHGRLAGLVPYDFRRPTVARVRATYWAPDNEHVLVPRVFGLGWGVNFGWLARIIRNATRNARPGSDQR